MRDLLRSSQWLMAEGLQGTKGPQKLFAQLSWSGCFMLTAELPAALGMLCRLQDAAEELAAVLDAEHWAKFDFLGCVRKILAPLQQARPGSFYLSSWLRRLLEQGTGRCAQALGRLEGAEAAASTWALPCASIWLARLPCRLTSVGCVPHGFHVPFAACLRTGALRDGGLPLPPQPGPL